MLCVTALLTRRRRAIIHLSVITATIPRINSFIADMQTRRAGLALTHRDYESYKQSKSGSKNGSGNRSGNRSRNRSGKWDRSKSPEPVGMLNSFRPDPKQNLRNDFTNPKVPEEIEMDNRDQVETGSQSSLRGNAVYWKTEFRWVSLSDRKSIYWGALRASIAYIC